MVQPDNVIFFSAKEKWAIKTWKYIEEPQMHITKWKKPIWKDYIVYYFNCMIFWKRQNYGYSAVVKTLPANRHRSSGFNLWVGKISWSRKWQPTPLFLPGKSHGQKSLAGHSPRGHKESDTTEYTHTHTHTHHSFFFFFNFHLGFPGCAMVKNPPANAGYAKDMSSIPGLGRLPGVGNGKPLQYSCLENCTDRWSWWATVHGLQTVGHDWVTEQTAHIETAKRPMVARDFGEEKMKRPDTEDCWAVKIL